MRAIYGFQRIRNLRSKTVVRVFDFRKNDSNRLEIRAEYVFDCMYRIGLFLFTRRNSGGRVV